MKKTVALRVVSKDDLSADSVILHPNDGFDLGMLTREYSVNLCLDISLDQFLGGDDGVKQPANVELLNECPQQTLQLSLQKWKSLGKPDTAMVFYDGKRLFVQSVRKV